MDTETTDPINTVEDEEIKQLFESPNDEDFDIDKEISELKIEMEESNLDESDNENEKQLEEMADDIIKIQDRQAQKQMQLDLLVDIIKTIGFDVSNIKDISSLTFDRDFLKQKSIQDKIIAFIPELRKCYNSAYLTCLHANAEKKQKNLGINVLRQILKCNYLNMKPKVVSHGYDKASGKKLELTLGFSHPVHYELPEQVEVETPSQTEVVLKSHDKQVLGQVAAEIRAFRPPEPYKGKGVKYSDENIRRKEAKKAAGA